MTIHVGQQSAAIPKLRPPSMRLLQALALKRRLENRDEDSEVPLCVALDGTLIRGPLTHEAVRVLMRKKPGALVKLLPMALAAPARFKARLCEMAGLDPARLPFRQKTVRLLEVQHAQGRVMVLVGAGDRRIVKAVADHVGMFAESLGSDGQKSLSAVGLARMLCKSFGPGGFDYLGAERRDIPAWATARRAMIISPEPRLLQHPQWASQTARILAIDPRRPHPWLDAMRPSHWPRNLLVMLPVLARDVFTIERLVIAYCAACACGLVAAASDVATDAFHLPRDIHRSADLVLDHAFVLSGFLAALGFLAAFILSPALALWLALYPVLATLHARWLRHVQGLDILSLTAFDMHHLLAGSVAIGAAPFFWQAASATPFFLSLAARHRHHALAGTVRPEQEWIERLALPAFGIVAGFVSAIVLALYARGGDAARALGAPPVIGVLCPVLICWIIMIWIERLGGSARKANAAFQQAARRVVGATAAGIFAVAFLFPG